MVNLAQNIPSKIAYNPIFDLEGERQKYRKTFLAWDKLERANKPTNATERTKKLSKNAKALLSVICQKVKKQGSILLNHKYISSITGTCSRQNNRVISELKDVLDISYHRSEKDEKGKLREYVYKFTSKSGKNEPQEKELIRTKMSASNAPTTYIEKINYLNNRSSLRSNFVNSCSSFSDSKERVKTSESCQKPESHGVNSGSSQAKSFHNLYYGKESPSSSGFLGGKYLPELLEYLDEDACSKIRMKCGKRYTDRAIREIAKAVSRSKKGAKAFFYHAKGFIAYLAKILTFEKRDPVRISGDTFYIKANQTDEEQEIKKQEDYLTKLEYSLQVSPEWHLKKKLAAVLERSKAYNLLTAYKSIEIKGDIAHIALNKEIELSDADKNTILQQVQATHERIDYEDGTEVFINELKITIDEKKEVVKQVTEGLPPREGVWGKIRETFASYFGDQGDLIDTSWTSKLTAEMDKDTVNLKAPTEFIRSYIEDKYMSQLKMAARANGIKEIIINYGNYEKANN